MAAHKENEFEGLKTIQGLREENRWLKAMNEWQAARIRVLESVISSKDPQLLEAIKHDQNTPPPLQV